MLFRRGVLVVFCVVAAFVGLASSSTTTADVGIDIDAYNQMDMSMYHSTEQLAAAFQELATSCSRLSVEDITKEGKTLQKVVVKGGPKNVYMIFGEHARELISPETALHMVKYLCKAEGTPQDVHAKVDKVLAGHSFIILPNVNPFGRKMVEKGRYCHRTNNRGVDINRNYGDHWKADAESKRTRPGLFAFSEVESRIVKEVAKAAKPHVFMTVHSGALGMYLPYAYRKETVQEMRHETPQRRVMLEVLGAANKQYCNCGMGAAANKLNYLCPGNCLDYMNEKLHVPYSFAFEIFYKGSPSLIEQSATKFSRYSRAFLETDSVMSPGVGNGSGRLLNSLRLQALTKKQETMMSNSCLWTNDAKEERYEEELLAEQASLLEVDAEERSESVAGKSGMEEDLEDTVKTSALFPKPLQYKLVNCLTIFNPVQQEAFAKTVDNWSRAFIDITLGVQAKEGKVSKLQRI